tara:strand:- start:3267 stop:3407 length:141 start_codon:yes stop_codon:yes gene_type:complete
MRFGIALKGPMVFEPTLLMKKELNIIINLIIIIIYGFEEWLLARSG